MVQDIERREFIDALRGLAILGVLLVHSVEFVPPDTSTLHSLMRLGSRGVQLFYVVSAWTLCSSWEFRKPSETFAIRNFFLRRFFRIAPMFYLAIVLYLALDGFSPRYLAPNGIEWWFIPLTALFLHGLHPETIDSVVPGGWSVAVEMSFYLVLPFILRRWSSMRSYAFLLLFSVSLYAINKIVVVSWLSDFYPTEQQYLVSSYAFYNFFGQLPVFLMGMMAYQACKCEGMLRQLMLFGGLLVLVIPLAVLAVPVSVIIRLLESHLTAGAVFALLVVLLMRVPVLAIVNPLMTNLGKISFSMYLIHGAVLELYSAIGLTALCGRGDAVSVVFYLCVVTTTACVSYGTYKCIEAPGINFGKRLIRKLEHDNRSATSDQSVN